MGGAGSGRRWHLGAKSTTAEYRSIDVRRWARDKLLTTGRGLGWQWIIHGEKDASIAAHAEFAQVRRIYRSRVLGDEWENHDYPVRLLSPPCHYGGYRQWFACPARGCGRRVAKLYGGRIFACRHCCNFVYPSQREIGFQRSDARADKIRKRLGWTDDHETMEAGKPKGMHWRRYHRLVDALQYWETRSNLNFIQHFSERFGGKL